ncbi:hypothetical protein PYH37_006266 (plasmid) [Sinorhizobium numidicum]|uniref:Lipoprotein n=1 Tax=Sinorhizobium numidicum TaxID=680248 RepID=A0ABY8D7L7_9HYPH|nr:hypothetical protein [Sinorhizobium numidicum]WEX79376.1 hypothetical protein PYH37_006266 [Sinorhizobium numidicum]WEX85667.1 hypothetical protein PYH38_006118 [Sinorhizobium numidicum]
MKTFTRPLALISHAVASGCTTMEDARPAMQGLKGQPVQAAFAKLGYPDEEQNIAGRKIYVWHTSSSGTYMVPTTNTATTYVNGQAIYSTVEGTLMQSYEDSCKLRLIASRGGIIEEWDWHDNNGCERYAAQLKG